MLSHEVALLATLCLSGVDEVKEIFNEVEKLSLTKQSLQDCSDDTQWDVEVFRDASGAIRKLERAEGSEDHTQTVTSYFDARGRVRFVFLKAGAVPDGHVEMRWWLDENGKVIKQKRKAWGEGPTYFGNELKPHLVRDAASYVKNVKRCP